MDNPTASVAAPSQPSQPVVSPVKSILPVHVDGALYVTIGVAGSLLASLSTDFAEKNISPLTLFWFKTTVEALLAGASSLKMFRSTSYADSTKAST